MKYYISLEISVFLTLLIQLIPNKLIAIDLRLLSIQRNTVHIEYSDNAGGIYFWAKLSLYPKYHYIQ